MGSRGVIPRRALIHAIVLLVLSTAASCAGEPTPATTTPAPSTPSTPAAVTSTPSDQPDNTGTGELVLVPNATQEHPALTQRGTATVHTELATLNGGRVHMGDDGGRMAVRMPEFVLTGTYPRAVFTVTVVDGQPDVLQPRTSDFTLSAEFRLNGVSTGRPDDNGDNLIQRGLASDLAQYKLEIDRNRPACRVQGTQGVLEVRAMTELSPKTWYSVACSRHGDSLKLTVHSELPNEEDDVTTVSGPLGDVHFDDSVRVAVGGKVTRRGQIVRNASDQFNGSISRVEFSTHISR